MPEELKIPEELNIWLAETMAEINRLTPDVVGKAFDPDWFLLRQRFEEIIRRIATLEQANATLETRWDEHTKHVGRFLTDMYQTMIDPLDEPEPSLKIADLCEMLLTHARQDREKLNQSEQALTQVRLERDGLQALLNTPETEDFDKAIPLEAAHQVTRWGAEHDAGKAPMDWFWLVGYLAGKALASHLAGNTEKAKHHCVSTAAVLRNWHAHIRSGESVMRPGISEEKVAALASTEGESFLDSLPDITRTCDLSTEGQPPLCGECVIHLIAGASYYPCALPKGHCDGHRAAGECFAHGKYLGEEGAVPQCPEWPKCAEIMAQRSIEGEPQKENDG